MQRTTAYRTLVHALQSDDFYDLAQELAAILFPFYLLFEAKGETDAEKLEPIRLRVFELWREFVDRHPFLRKVNPQLALPLGVVSAEKPDSVSPDPVPGCLPSKSLDELEKDKAAEWRPVRPDRLAEALAERKSGRLRRVLEVAATKEEHVRYASERLGWRVEPLAGIQTKEQARAAAWLLIERAAPRWFLGFRNVTNPTNERTAVFSVAPRTGCGKLDADPTHDRTAAQRSCCLYGNLASLPLDWVVRQKVAGVNMNFFYVEQLPVLPPERYAPEDLLFLVPRVMELVYTAWDVKPFADDVWLDADEPLREAMRKQRRENREANGAPEPDPPDWLSAYPEIETDPQRGIPFGPFAWNADRRARLQAEVDAYFARLYGLTRKQLRYILDPADLTEKEREDLLSDFEEVQDPLDPAGYQARVLQNTAQDGTDEKFPWETFRVLKKNEIREFGEYRTRRLVLEAWARLRRG
ncbi:MAG: hypothetical protein KatS3mg015_3160 [Fimbriimonadales bacterium]|nr:MAG: hypothetical protein KatS3mg015_3160 [Fimbriimonadales bacterium]